MTKEKTQPDLFPDNSITSGILTDDEISDYVARGSLIVSNSYKQTCLEASSYDVRVGHKAILGGVGIEIDLKKDVLELAPGAYGGILSYEKFKLPSNISARIGSKRALSYDGVILLTGTSVDPGYEGHLLFGLYNASQRKVIIRLEKKICNIVFERLPRIPEKQAPSHPDLLTGNFPDNFIDRMANMDVLPWMQISERVKQIENITKDIIDLKQRYEDVLQPIKDLTGNVKTVSDDVGRLTSQTKEIAKDLEQVNGIVNRNSEQIAQLTANLGTIGGHIQTTQSKISDIEQSNRDQTKEVTKVKTDFGRFKILVYIFWAIVLLIAGSLLPKLIDLISNSK